MAFQPSPGPGSTSASKKPPRSARRGFNHKLGSTTPMSLESSVWAKTEGMLFKYGSGTGLEPVVAAQPRASTSTAGPVPPSGFPWSRSWPRPFRWPFAGRENQEAGGQRPRRARAKNGGSSTIEIQPGMSSDFIDCKGEIEEKKGLAPDRCRPMGTAALQTSKAGAYETSR